MYEINDLAESPDVEYPAVPPKQQSFSSLPQHNARSTASYASLNYNGKVRQSISLIL